MLNLWEHENLGSNRLRLDLTLTFGADDCSCLAGIAGAVGIEGGDPELVLCVRSEVDDRVLGVPGADDSGPGHDADLPLLDHVGGDGGAAVVEGWLP